MRMAEKKIQLETLLTRTYKTINTNAKHELLLLESKGCICGSKHIRTRLISMQRRFRRLQSLSLFRCTAFDLSLSLSFSLLSTHAKYRHENEQVNRKKLKWFTYKLIGMISSFRAIHAINKKHWIPLRPNFMEGLFCIRRVKSIQYISDSSFPMKWRQKQREKTKRETDRFFWNPNLTQVSKQKSIVLYWMLVCFAQV